MKFLCPQCKAKYRIADEKLAQRASSRMKCRKCGHVIDIHTAMSESIRPKAPAAHPGGAVGSDDPSGEGEPEAPSPSPPRAAMRSGAGVARRGAGSSAGGGSAAKRVGAVAKVNRGAPPRRGGAAVAEAEPEKLPLPDDEEEPAETRRIETEPVAQPLRKNDFEEDVATRIHDGAALAAAFSISSPTASPADSASEDWYVGIDGNPVGPLGTSQLRERAAAGKVTAESLVWKDGFEEWKALKDFPELVSILEEKPLTAVAAGSVVVSDPQSFAEGSKARAPGSELSSGFDEVNFKARRSTSHPMAWVAIFVALALGVTIGAVALSSGEQKGPVVKYVEVPVSAKPAEAPVASDTVLEEQSVAGEATKHVAGSTPTKVEPAVAPPKTGLSSLNGLNGLSGLGPATQGPNAGSQAPAPGGQLDGTSIQRTVAGFTPGVRRGCWDSALASRAADAPSSARVALTITIAPAGNVADVRTSGDPKGYAGLARCIESKVRGWHFPRSSGTTTAQVPFVFAAQ